jgi:catalase
MVADLKQCPKEIAMRMVWHWWHCDEDYGRRVAAGAGIDLEEAKLLPPLARQAATRREAPGKYLYERSVRS